MQNWKIIALDILLKIMIVFGRLFIITMNFLNINPLWMRLNIIDGYHSISGFKLEIIKPQYIYLNEIEEYKNTALLWGLNFYNGSLLQYYRMMNFIDDINEENIKNLIKFKHYDIKYKNGNLYLIPLNNKND